MQMFRERVMLAALIWSIFVAQGLLAADIAHHGVVRWRNQAVPGAVVMVSSAGQMATTTTDERGEYRVEGLKPGTWTVHVEMFGFQTIERSVELDTANAPLSWSLDLSPLVTSASTAPPSQPLPAS